MWQGFTGWHALIILVVILLLFGAPKLPALARSLGQSMKILKSEVVPRRTSRHDRDPGCRREHDGRHGEQHERGGQPRQLDEDRRGRFRQEPLSPMSAVKDRGEKNREKRMSLGAHLIELRKRLFISAIAIVVGMALGWWLTDAFVWQAIQEPVERVAEAQGNDTAIIFPTISSAFDLRLQIAFTLGIVVSAPVWLYQIFAFLVPGLNTRERSTPSRSSPRRSRCSSPAARRAGSCCRNIVEAHDELRPRGRRVAAHARRSTSTSC